MKTSTEAAAAVVVVVVAEGDGDGDDSLRNKPGSLLFPVEGDDRVAATTMWYGEL